MFIYNLCYYIPMSELKQTEQLNIEIDKELKKQFKIMCEQQDTTMLEKLNSMIKKEVKLWLLKT